MLVGSRQENYLFDSYTKVLQDILRYLNGIDLQYLSLGRHELPGFAPEQAWFVLMEYKKEPIENFNPEVHHRHSDIQMVIEGREIMGWAIDTGNHSPAEIYNEERDLQYYKPEGIHLNLMEAHPGLFYLFTPDTIHVANIEDGSEGIVRKLVVKIHNDLLVK